MDVDDRRSGPCGCDGVVRDLFGADWNVLALAGGVPGSRDGTGEDDLAVHDDSFSRSVDASVVRFVVDGAVVVVAAAAAGCMMTRSR